MSKWLLVDGFNLAYRCFFAIPELTRADGFPTNALHGWVKSLWRLQDQEFPTGMRVFFDLGGAQDRLAILPEYKAQRAEMPEALRTQLPVLKELTRAMGFEGIEQDGVESDDLLASEALMRSAAGDEVLIVSSDKDFAQIVGERIEILLPPSSSNPRSGWRRLDAAGVLEKFGVPPHQIVDYLALIGDSSDNISGIAGVGPKTAAKWMAEYGGVDKLLDSAASVKPERFRELLREQAGILKRNQRLITLNPSLPVRADTGGSLDVDAVLRLLETMEMKSAHAEAVRRYAQPTLLL